MAVEKTNLDLRTTPSKPSKAGWIVSCFVLAAIAAFGWFVVPTAPDSAKGINSHNSIQESAPAAVDQRPPNADGAPRSD